MIAICLVGLMFFVSCDSKGDNSLVGEWVTAGNNHNHVGDGGVIIFGNNFDVRGSFVGNATNITYSLSENEITFTFHESSGDNHSHSFGYVLRGNRLTIKHFCCFVSFNAKARSEVHFIRVQ